MLTETQKKYWFNVYYKGIKIGEGDEESRLIITKNYMVAHPEINWNDYNNVAEFNFELTKLL